MAHAKRKFQYVARRQHPAVFDFEREVAQAWKSFPEIKDKVLFVDALAGKLVYPDQGAARENIERNVEVRHIPSSIKRGYEFHGANSFCRSLGDGGRMIFLYTSKHPHDVVAAKAPVAQESTFVFDHELGHAILEFGMPGNYSRNRCEAVADAYAVIRHFQRYGANSPVIDDIVANRAFDLIFRKPGYGHDHFSSPVTEKILAARHEIDWDSLTPQETTQLACKFVLEHEMESEALGMLHKDFSSFNNHAKDIEHGDAAPLHALAEKVLNTDCAEIFKYGAAALTLCIDKRASGVILKGPYWNAVRRKLDEKREASAKLKPMTVSAQRSFRP